MSEFKKYYKLPLHCDKYGAYAWAKNGTMALTFDSKLPKDDRQKIVDCINGESNDKIQNIKYKDHEFFDGDKFIFCVRGWGFLTGVGACNLSGGEAVKIQDGFIEHIHTALKP